MRPPRGQPHNNVYSLVYMMVFVVPAVYAQLQLGLSVVLHSPGGHMLHSW